MIAYLFKFDRNTAENGTNKDLLNFISDLAINEGDVFNYTPSKLRAVLGVQSSVYNKICNYIRENVKYNFEFEEHSDEDRSLTQFEFNHKSFSVQYMLPLFRPEQTLEL